MKYQPLTRLAIATVAIVVLLAIVPTSCKQNPAGASATDSSGVVQKDSAYWSNPFIDGRHGAKTPLVAYLYPIHDKQGKVVAVLDADLSLDFMAQLLDKQDSIFAKDSWVLGENFGSFQSYVLRSDGTYLTHPEQRRILKGNFFVHVKDYDTPGVAENAIIPQGTEDTAGHVIQYAAGTGRENDPDIGSG